MRRVSAIPPSRGTSPVRWWRASRPSPGRRSARARADGSVWGPSPEHQQDQPERQAECGRDGGPPNLAFGGKLHVRHRTRLASASRTPEPWPKSLALQVLWNDRVLVGRPAGSRTDDLGHDALEVVGGAELDHDLAPTLAHLDLDAGRELFREQLLDLG